MTHDSCFPEHSNRYCKETCCVLFFFFSPHRLSGWVRTGKAGRSKKLSKKKKWINSSVNLSWAFTSDELHRVPPAEVTGCPKALHQKAKGSLKMQITPGGTAVNRGLTDPNIQTPTSQMHHHILTPSRSCTVLPGCPGLRRRILEVFISSKKNKYIKPLCSTSTETFHMGEGKRRKWQQQKAADHLYRLGAQQCGYLQQNKSSPQWVPASRTVPRSTLLQQKQRTCCKFQKLLRGPKAAICRRPVLASAHPCRGWKVFKHSHDFKHCRNNRALQVETHPTGPCRCLGVQPESLSKNNMNMQIMQDKVKWDHITRHGL